MIRIKRAAAIAATTATAAAGAWLAASALHADAAFAAGSAPTVAYLRGGDIYVATGTNVRRLTTGGGNARPHWSPDGTRIAYLHGGSVWVMNADGGAKQRAAAKAAGAPAWSPDGHWLAFEAPACGGPTIFKVASTAPFGTPAPLLPGSACAAGMRARATDAGAEQPDAVGSASLADALGHDDAVSWSPDGTRIAFRGGDCEGTFDDCLTVATIATGGQTVVDAYGGGGVEASGFAVVPAWRPDGAKLSWTAYADGEAVSLPVHVTEASTAGTDRRTVGAAMDRELAYVDNGRAVLTATRDGASWVTLVDLGTGRRTYLRPGSQPSPRPGT